MSGGERKILQIAIGIAGAVPVMAGAAGAWRPNLLDLAGAPAAMTHAAYLSGLLLGVGLAAWSVIPAIEKQGRALGLLAALVFCGGLARGYTALRLGVATPMVLLPLGMELIVTPSLWLWQRRVARLIA